MQRRSRCCLPRSPAPAARAGNAAGAPTAPAGWPSPAARETVAACSHPPPVRWQWRARPRRLRCRPRARNAPPRSPPAKPPHLPLLSTNALRPPADTHPRRRLAGQHAASGGPALSQESATRSCRVAGESPWQGGMPPRRTSPVHGIGNPCCRRENSTGRGIVRCYVCILVMFMCAAAQETAVVRGVVHDAQHRPIAGAQITLRGAGATRTVTGDAEGEFRIEGLAAGAYTIEASSTGFRAATQTIEVTAARSPVVHLQLDLAPVTSSIEVSSRLAAQTSTVETNVSATEVLETPGADQTNSLAMITDFTPGAYMVHDMLHMRGGHQVNWFFDGIPVVNTNIAANVAPLINPKNVQELEVERGGFSERIRRPHLRLFQRRDALRLRAQQRSRVILSAGNFYSTDDQFNPRRPYPALRLLRQPGRQPLRTGPGDSGLAGDSRPGQRRGRICFPALQPQRQGSIPLDRLASRRSLPDSERCGRAGRRHLATWTWSRTSWWASTGRTRFPTA